MDLNQRLYAKLHILFQIVWWLLLVVDLSQTAKNLTVGKLKLHYMDACRKMVVSFCLLGIGQSPKTNAGNDADNEYDKGSNSTALNKVQANLSNDPCPSWCMQLEQWETGT